MKEKVFTFGKDSDVSTAIIWRGMAWRAGYSWQKPKRMIVIHAGPLALVIHYN